MSIDQPKILLQWSDDGGETWGNGRIMDVGRSGEYLTRCRSLCHGSSRDRVYRVTCSDPVKITLVGANVDIKQGNS